MWTGHNCWINFCHFFDIGMGVEWGAGATPLSVEFWLEPPCRDVEERSFVFFISLYFLSL